MRRDGSTSLPEPGAPAALTAGDDLADAHHALGYVSSWVNNADMKAGLLAAAVAVVLAAAAQQTNAIGDVLRPGDGRELAALVILCLLGISLIIATGALALVVIPRTPPPTHPSRFGFPSLASHGWRGQPATREEVAQEAWDQTAVISRIAAKKFAALRVAAIATFASFLLSIAWILGVSLTAH